MVRFCNKIDKEGDKIFEVIKIRNKLQKKKKDRIDSANDG
jgi:hypothetical protein